jgi:uncharacterized SAM-binding protein YcdF (DUF218 family)
VLLLLLIGLVGYFVSTPILTMLGGALEEDGGPPRKADAILVLGGDRYGERTTKGAQLVKAGFAPLVYVSGPPRLMGWESMDEVQFAEKQGFPASFFEEVHLPEEAESTRTEAQFLGKFLAAKGVHSILLVTSNFHTKRAGKLWRQVNPQIQMQVVGAPDPFFSPNGWWKTRPGQKTFAFEWMKTISVTLGI